MSRFVAFHLGLRCIIKYSLNDSVDVNLNAPQ